MVEHCHNNNVNTVCSGYAVVDSRLCYYRRMVGGELFSVSICRVQRWLSTPVAGQQLLLIGYRRQHFSFGRHVSGKVTTICFVQLCQTTFSQQYLPVFTTGKRPLRNNASWFAHFWESWLGNSISWFCQLLGNMNRKQCFLLCPIFVNIAKKQYFLVLSTFDKHG